jgi:ferritin-like metal-binding protein YciE
MGSVSDKIIPYREKEFSMKKIDSLDLLLQEEVKDLYDAEKRLLRAIPKMAKAASSEALSSALTEHLEVTRTHVARLEKIFELLEAPAKGKPCAGMKGIIEEGDETLGQNASEGLMDAAIIGAAQRVEHYEMAAYAAARAMAEHLGNTEVAGLLEETWEEEHEADEKLAELAEQILSSVSEREEISRTAGASPME